VIRGGVSLSNQPLRPMVYCVKPLTVPFANVIGMACALVDSAGLTLCLTHAELHVSFQLPVRSLA
jgi:hypothetical protein